MKIKYQELHQKPRLFKSLFGVTVSEFEDLYAKVLPEWAEREVARLNARPRQRAIGGGRKYDLALRERLRIIVENTLGEIKHFKILAERFRHQIDLYDAVFRAVIALVNPRIKQRVALKMAT